MCFIPANGEKLIKPLVSQIQTRKCWKERTLFPLPGMTDDTSKGGSSSFRMSPAGAETAGTPGAAVAPGKELHLGSPWEGRHVGAWSLVSPRESLAILMAVPQ